MKKIGLDVDGVLACFVGGVLKRAGELGIREHFPATCRDVQEWSISPAFGQVWSTIDHDISFWLKLRPLPYTLPLDFQPDCYITARRIPSWITEHWLAIHRFPRADVITVATPDAKLAHVLERGLDLFVDDHIETVRQMVDAGANAVLYEAPYQRGHDTANLPVIKHLSEVKNVIPR